MHTIYICLLKKLTKNGKVNKFSEIIATVTVYVYKHLYCFAK